MLPNIPTRIVRMVWKKIYFRIFDSQNDFETISEELINVYYIFRKFFYYESKKLLSLGVIKGKVITGFSFILIHLTLVRKVFLNTFSFRAK